MHGKLQFQPIKAPYIIFTFIICLAYNTVSSEIGLKFKSVKNKKIFSFWEPIKKMPGYIHLCIKTWKKFLTEYEIHILDFKGVKHYLGNDIYSNIICVLSQLLTNQELLNQTKSQK